MNDLQLVHNQHLLFVRARVNRPALLMGSACAWCVGCGLVWTFSRGRLVVLRVCLGLWRVLFVSPSVVLCVFLCCLGLLRIGSPSRHANILG